MPLVLKFLLWALALLVLLIAVAFVLAARHTARAEAAHPPEGQFIEVDGRRVHAVVAGAGPDVVLIHGSSGSTRDFTFGLVDALSGNYRVIAFDRPGHGYSDPLPGGGSITDQARLLQAAAAALGADKPVVLGQSYGGAVALAWAIDRPDTLSALVPVSSPSQPWEGPLPWLYQLNSTWWAPYTSIPLIAAFVPDAYVQSQLEAVFLPQDMPDGFDTHIGVDLILRPMAQRANALQRATLLEEVRAMQPRYPDISVPIEIVHGDADDTVPFEIHAQPLAEQAPTARLTRLPGIGHLPQHVAKGDVIAAVDRAATRAGLRYAAAPAHSARGTAGAEHERSSL